MIKLLHRGAEWWEVVSGVWERKGSSAFSLYIGFPVPGNRSTSHSCPRHLGRRNRMRAHRAVPWVPEGLLAAGWPVPPQLLATPGHNQALGGHVEILTSLGRLRGPSSYYVSRGRGGGGICLRRSPWRPGAEHKGSARTAAGRGKPWRTEPGSEPPAPAVSKREVYGGPQRSTVSVSALL